MPRRQTNKFSHLHHASGVTFRAVTRHRSLVTPLRGAVAVAAGTRSMPAATRAPTLYVNLETRLPDGMGCAANARGRELPGPPAGIIVPRDERTHQSADPAGPRSDPDVVAPGLASPHRR